jgi:hypothetical protein
MNSSIVSIPFNREGTMETARIIGVSGQQWIAAASRGEVLVEQAVSCLVTPELGDLVVLFLGQDSYYVLSILDRQSQDVSLSVKGKLSVSSDDTMQIHSRSSLVLGAEEKVTQTASKLNHIAGELNFTSRSLSTNTDQLKIHATDVQLHAEQVHSFIRRSFQKAKEVMRWVDTVETVSIGNLVQNVQNTLSSRAKNSLITAKEDVKVDAKRIHMG